MITLKKFLFINNFILFFLLFFSFFHLLSSSSSSSSSYNPPQFIQNMHLLPHLNTKLKLVDNTFNLLSKKYSNYVISIVVFPVILGAVGIIILLGYLLGLLIRCCLNCCNVNCCLCCGPIKDKEDEEDEERKKKGRCCLYYLLCCCCFCYCCCKKNDNVIYKHKRIENNDENNHEEDENNIKDEEVGEVEKETNKISQEQQNNDKDKDINSNEKNKNKNKKVKTTKYPHHKRNLTIVFFSCLVILFAFDIRILIGNSSINRGVTRVIDAVDFVGDTFQSILYFIIFIHFHF